MFPILNHLLGPAYFWLFSALILGCGVGVLISRHPLNGAVNLVGVMVALGGVYSLLSSPFLGVLQILVYAGAIMMLVVFVIMVLNQARDHQVPRFDYLSLAGIAVALMLSFILIHGTHGEKLTESTTASRAEVGNLAPVLFDMTPAGPGLYLLFELIGVLLLIAIVAAVLLSKRELDSPPAQLASENAAEDPHGHH